MGQLPEEFVTPDVALDHVYFGSVLGTRGKEVRRVPAEQDVATGTTVLTVMLSVARGKAQSVNDALGLLADVTNVVPLRPMRAKEPPPGYKYHLNTMAKLTIIPDPTYVPPEE
jgi:hypothetical protein